MACDDHSDRLMKGEFWCFICLGFAVVESATGRVTDHAEHLSAEDIAYLESHVSQRAAVSNHFEQFTNLISPDFVETVFRGQNLVFAQDDDSRDRTTNLIRLGAALLSACLGTSEWLTDRPTEKEDDFIKSYAHPVLVNAMGMGLERAMVPG